MSPFTWSGLSALHVLCSYLHHIIELYLAKLLLVVHIKGKNVNLTNLVANEISGSFHNWFMLRKYFDNCCKYIHCALYVMKMCTEIYKAPCNFFMLKPSTILFENETGSRLLIRELTLKSYMYNDQAD